MARSLPILTFHAWDDLPSVLSFPTDVFVRGIRKLYENGFRTLSLETAVSCARDGAEFPERALVITIDDGYRSVYEFAFPVLQEFGMTATLFLTVGADRAKGNARPPAVDGRSMLCWKEVDEMHRYGFSIGAHTLTHPDLTRVSTTEVEREVCGSKQRIEDALGVPVRCFSYPFGRFDRRSIELAREHFSCASSDRLGSFSARSDLYALERVDAYYLRTDRKFDRLRQPSFPWYLRARNVPRRLRRACRTALSCVDDLVSGS